MYLLEGAWSFLIKNGEATEGRGPIVKYGEILVEGEECGKGRSGGGVRPVKIPWNSQRVTVL